MSDPMTLDEACRYIDGIAVAKANRLRNTIVPKAAHALDAAIRMHGIRSDEFELAFAALNSLLNSLEMYQRCIASACDPWFGGRR